jgi:hypothetical protein
MQTGDFWLEFRGKRKEPMMASLQRKKTLALFPRLAGSDSKKRKRKKKDS